MLRWIKGKFEKRRIAKEEIAKKLKRQEELKIINSYNNSSKVKDLILDIFGRKDSYGFVDNDEYEDNIMKINYSATWSGNNKVYTYSVNIKKDCKLIEVFHRIMIDGGSENVSKFILGNWIYYLCLIKNGKIDLDSMYTVVLENEKKPEILNEGKQQPILKALEQID